MNCLIILATIAYLPAVTRSAIETSKLDSYLNAVSFIFCFLKTGNIFQFPSRILKQFLLPHPLQIWECSGYKGRIGGMTISGVKDGQVVYRGNFGNASIKDNKPFSNQTR